MAGFSDSYENKVLDLFFSRVGFVVPNLYLALGFGLTDEDTGETFSETVGLGYYRIGVPGAYWSLAANGFVQNIVEIGWIPGALEDWSTVSHFVFLDTEAQGEGEIIAYGLLAEQWDIVTGSSPRFETGEIKIYLD